MTGRCPECGHDPSSDELERRCEQLEEENRRLRELLVEAVGSLGFLRSAFKLSHPKTSTVVGDLIDRVRAAILPASR